MFVAKERMRPAGGIRRQGFAVRGVRSGGLLAYWGRRGFKDDSNIHQSASPAEWPYNAGMIGDLAPAGPASNAGGLAAVESAYRDYALILRSVSLRKFRIPERDVDSIVQEVFLSYIVHVEAVEDVRAWLFGAICNASRAYWRKHPPTEVLSPDFELASRDCEYDLATRIAVRETLARLQQKCRDTLRLHYVEGLSAREVAETLATTRRYAEKLIHKCLRRAHEIYAKLVGVPA